MLHATQAAHSWIAVQVSSLTWESSQACQSRHIKQQTDFTATATASATTTATTMANTFANGSGNRSLMTALQRAGETTGGAVDIGKSSPARQKAWQLYLWPRNNLKVCLCVHVNNKNKYIKNTHTHTQRQRQTTFLHDNQRTWAKFLPNNDNSSAYARHQFVAHTACQYTEKNAE